MASATDAFTYGTTHGSRPIFKGRTSARAFVAEYLQWCNRFKWKGKERSENLQYCVAEQYRNFVKRTAYPYDDGISIAWEAMRSAFLDKYSIENEDAIALEEKERDLNDMETSKMREDESVADYTNRFEELCGKINRFRRRLAGEEPPKPETILNTLRKGFAAKKAGVEDSLRKALFQSPNQVRHTANDASSSGSSSSSSPISNTSPSTSTSSNSIPDMTELMEYKRAKATIWSEQYLNAVKAHTTWSSKFKPPMDDQEMLRLFMARLNSLYYERAHGRFIPLRSHTLRVVTEWMREVERIENRSKARVRFPSAAQLQASADALEQRREMDAMKQELARLREEASRHRQDNQGTLCAATGSHGMHPDRRRLQEQDQRNGDGRTTQARGNGYGRRRCTLCNSDGHTMWNCPTACSRCGGGHPSATCNRTDLYCDHCGVETHSGTVCNKKKSGVPAREKRQRPQNGKRSHRSPRRGSERTDDSTSSNVCWNWREKGSCSYGERCRFSHQENTAKRPRQEQRQPPAPAPANQATATYPMPPVVNGTPPMPYNTQLQGFYGMGNPGYPQMGNPVPYQVQQVYGGGPAPTAPMPPPVPPSQPPRAAQVQAQDNASFLAVIQMLQEQSKRIDKIASPSKTPPASEGDP